MSKPFVYGLVDSLDTGHVRYVGMAYRSACRPYDHAKCARKRPQEHSHLFHWIRKLQVEGREPAVMVLEEVAEGFSRSLLGFVESCYIKSLREIGHKLTNVMPGGDGAHGPRSPETRQKIKEWWTPERREAQAARVRGSKQSPETTAKIALSNTGKERTNSWRASISASLVGKKRSLESRARQSAVCMGRKNTAESNAKRSATQSGRKDSAELREKKRAAAFLREAKRRNMRAAGTSRTEDPDTSRVSPPPCTEQEV